MWLFLLSLGLTHGYSPVFQSSYKNLYNHRFEDSILSLPDMSLLLWKTKILYSGDTRRTQCLTLYFCNISDDIGLSDSLHGNRQQVATILIAVANMPWITAKSHCTVSFFLFPAKNNKAYFVTFVNGVLFDILQHCTFLLWGPCGRVV